MRYHSRAVISRRSYGGDEQELAATDRMINNFDRCSATSLVQHRLEMARIETTLAKQEAMRLKLLESLWGGRVLLALSVSWAMQWNVCMLCAKLDE